MNNPSPEAFNALAQVLIGVQQALELASSKLDGKADESANKALLALIEARRAMEDTAGWIL